MSRNYAISLCLFSALLGISICPFALGAEPSVWLEIHSTHFTVITDAGDRKGREVALRFEQMRAVFATLLGKERLHQSVPLSVLAFGNDKSYYQAAPLVHVHAQGQARGQPIDGRPIDGGPIDVPGFFLSGDDQDFIVLNLSEPEPWRAVARDFAAMLLYYNYPPAQAWFDEGLIEYFRSIRVDNKEVELGRDPTLSAPASSSPQDSAGTQPDSSLTGLLRSQAWLPLPDLFSAKNDNFTRNGAAPATMYDAESWIVMHYLLHEQKLPETGAYFGLVLNQRVPADEAIQRAYGMSSTDLEQAVKDYFQSQGTQPGAVDASRQTAKSESRPNQSYRFPVPVGPDDAAITSRALPESDARALYAEVQIRIPERRETGLKALQDLSTLPTATDKKLEAKFEARKAEKKSGEDPDLLPSDAIGNAIAHRVLAWDHIQHSEFAEASSELKDANALNPRDMWIRYYVCVLKYRIAQAGHSDIQGLPNMMLDLKTVLEWYPELADAYDLLAIARNAGGGPAAALQAERNAISLSPRDERYSYHLAQIYVTSKKWEAANILLDRLKASSNPQVAAQARDLVEQAGTERKYGIPVKSGGMEQTKLAPQKSPFDVLEEDAAKRAAVQNSPRTAESGDRRPTKFLKGRLVAVDCSQSPAAILTVAAEGTVLKLHAADYKSVLLMGADDFSCDWRDRQVTVNYKASGARDGDLVSLEMR